MNSKFSRTVLPILLLFGSLLLGVKFARASAESLDPTFGNGGITMTSSADRFSLINAVRVQSDSKFLSWSRHLPAMRSCSIRPPACWTRASAPTE